MTTTILNWTYQNQNFQFNTQQTRIPILSGTLWSNCHELWLVPIPVYQWHPLQWRDNSDTKTKVDTCTAFLPMRLILWHTRTLPWCTPRSCHVLGLMLLFGLGFGLNPSGRVAHAICPFHPCCHGSINHTLPIRKSHVGTLSHEW